MSNDIHEDKLLVLLEGQQHWVRKSIADNDDLLRMLFSGLSPELAAAEIQREPSQIKIVPKKGTKGTIHSSYNLPTAASVLAVLDTAPSEVDPAILMCVKLRKIELLQGINPCNAQAIVEQIETAIAQSRHSSDSVKQCLKRLDQSLAVSAIPVGF
ncbi:MULTISPECIES: hypothetical protein [Cyanophyceae]|uniref:hypothetical protein n=1 Tax=Cyanophyceae TaxID=3028117 RepID=UPI0002A6615C|nr:MULTISPECIES: hypothetical protein [Cyanophyceae]AFZ33562.1 hypothetical protein Glo7428_5181 [Gloeocapsa sp. PCC 7428]PIG91545.1 hypothetical protein CSQ79_20065 [Gloeocapsopsis sp. IPPAS B-1203]PPS42066.1 hypothetical protein B1A85_16530 [Chroococcidiopsis sp. TS-821]